MNFTFTTIPNQNFTQYRKLRKIYETYKINTLRNHGETPCRKKIFYNLFDNVISRATDADSDHFIVMMSGKEILGFASISAPAHDFFDIPYKYGSINDFYISPKHRRKGYGRILNNYIEEIFIDNRIASVLLYPDPVYGIPFWKSMGYNDTGFHQGWGHYFVYCKHLIHNEYTSEIDNAISSFIKTVDTIGINPYNKSQIKEIYGIWKEYCKESNRKSHRKDVKNMAWNARKNRAVSFNALYYKGIIIGFTYKADNVMNYVLPEYRKEEIL